MKNEADSLGKEPRPATVHVLQNALKALRRRLATKPSWYRRPDQGDKDWYVTNFTHEQMEGNRLACVEQIDKALSTGSPADGVAAEKLWEVQQDNGNSNLFYICSAETGEPLIDFGFEYESVPQAFTELHNASLALPKPETEQRERWHIASDDAGCVVGENDNVIGLAQNADNAEHFVKEHNG